MWWISKEEALVGLRMFGWGLNCYILGDDFYICTYKYLKRDKKKINFDELPKKNSKIKITSIKIMRFKTKVLIYFIKS